jgi:hypothetical protein
MKTTSKAIAAFKKTFGQIDASKANTREKINAKLKIVCDELFAQMIAYVEAEYDGEGDSGDIHTLTFKDAHKNEISYDPPDVLRGVLYDACFEYLPAGFEIDYGGYGTLHIDVRQKEIKLEHVERVIETNQYTPRNYSF